MTPESQKQALDLLRRAADEMDEMAQHFGPGAVNPLVREIDAFLSQEDRP